MSEEAIRVAEFYDTLSEDKQEAVFRFLLTLVPYDDEPVTERELELIRKGNEEYARGECISLEELTRMEDFPMGEAV